MAPHQQESNHGRTRAGFCFDQLWPGVDSGEAQAYGTKISGEVLLKGKKVFFHNVNQAIKHGVAYVSEDRKTYGLNLLQNIRENTVLAGLNRISNKFGVIDKHQEIVSADGLRQHLHTKSSSIETNVSTLSGGNQQKVVFSKWLFNSPDILIRSEEH